MKKIYIAILLLTLCIAKTVYTTAQINVQDSLALVDLYDSTDGPHWKHSNNWLTENPVHKWYGITIKGNKIFNINLSGNGLKNKIPASLNDIVQLQFADFSYNQLTGISGPLRKLDSLHVLKLNNNNFTTIPQSIFTIPDLQYLSLSSNKLTGSIPSSIGTLSGLQELYLGDNQFSGNIPPSLGNLAKLQILSLYDNQLTGSIPSSLGNLLNLQYLNLSKNQLSGNIPASLGSLAVLTTLSLSQNNLTGNIPSSLGNCISLQTINLQANHLTGNIPESFKKLSALYGADFSHNNLSGRLPKALRMLTGAIWIDHNSFTFSGLELWVRKLSLYVYGNQAKIPVTKIGNRISVSAGGDVNRNIYRWRKDGALIITIKGDSTYTPFEPGVYSVHVTNSICTQLTLYSDTVSINTGDKNFYSNNSSADKLNTSFFVSPNPAKDILYLHINTDAKNALINIYDLNGKKLIAQNIALQKQNNIAINIASLAAGNYFIEMIADDKIMKQKFVKE